MRIISIALLAILAVGAFVSADVSLPAVSFNSAAIYVRFASGACAISVVDKTTGATQSVIVALKTTWADGTRLYQIGDRNGDNGLAYDRPYTVTVSGCVTSTTISFSTIAPKVGATYARPLPWNASKPYNLDTPTIDWSSKTQVIVEPWSGAPFRLINSAGDAGYSLANATSPFGRWWGGTGYGTPQNSISGVPGTNATTSGTTAIYLGIDPRIGGGLIDPYSNAPAWENLGLAFWGSGSDIAPGNRLLNVCLVVNGIDCASPAFQVQFPSGDLAQQVAGTGAQNLHPSTVYTPFFSGWNAPMYRWQWPQFLTVTCTAGSCTVPSPTSQNFLPQGMAAGSRIFITDSGCVDSVCTISAATNAATFTTVESITVTGAAATAMPTAVKLWKSNSTGTISFTAKYQMMGTSVANTVAEGMVCSREFTEGSFTGALCSVPERAVDYQRIYVLPSNGGQPVLISANKTPFVSQMSGWAAEDQPAWWLDKCPAPISFDDTDPRSWYCAPPNTSGLKMVMKLTYTGDLVTPLSTSYTGGVFGDLPYATEQVTWTNMTPASTSKNVAARVAATYPSFNTSLYGSTWALATNGVTGNYSVWLNNYNGQDGGPAWIAVQRLSDAAIVELYHTLNGEDPNGAVVHPRLSWCNQHSVYGIPTVPGLYGIACNILPIAETPNSSKLHNGPWVLNLTHVKKAGAWNADTSLPWPPDTSYDRTCPSGIAQTFKDFGATGENCAFFRVTDQPANTAPNTAEQAVFTAPSFNAGYRLNPNAQLRVGMKMIDTGNLPTPGDSESIRIVQVNPIAASTDLEVVVHRNAIKDYACAINGSPSDAENCGGGDARLQHSDNWIPRMNPGYEHTANSGTVLVLNPGGVESEMPYSLSVGHSTQSGHTGSTLVSRLSNVLFRYGVPLTGLSSYPVLSNSASYRAPWHTWQGLAYNDGAGKAQAYLNVIGAFGFALDGNANNPNEGSGNGNDLANQIGARSITAGTGTNVWKVGVIGTVDYKTRPLLGVVGPMLLKDRSPVNISSAPDYSLCYNYLSGSGASADCGQGVQGDVFVKAPNVYAYANGTTAMYWANIPTVISGWPANGWLRRLRVNRPDPEGKNSQLLTTALRPYLTHYPFWGATLHPGGKAFLVTSAGPLAGNRGVALFGTLPTFNDAATPATNALGGLPTKFGAVTGYTHARIEFGYDSNLYCTERAKTCVTDEVLTPYAFEDESTTAKDCASGCTFSSLPVIPGHLTYYRTRYCQNAGCTGTTLAGEISVAVP